MTRREKAQFIIDAGIISIDPCNLEETDNWSIYYMSNDEIDALYNDTMNALEDNTMNAKQLFPHLCAEVETEAQRKTADTIHYIVNGWWPSWSIEYRKDADRGLKEHSTARRWEQYQAGEISRDKAIEYATRRAVKEIDKQKESKFSRLEAAAKAPVITSASISVTWAKSRTWGANPTAEFWNAGEGYTTGHASGCGYDKESTAIAEAMNQSPAVLRILYTLGEAALERGESPASETACIGYNWAGCIGYGAGYSVLPYYEGGVGSSCFWSILEKAGYKVRCAGSGKMFDCYTIERTESATA